MLRKLLLVLAWIAILLVELLVAGTTIFIAQYYLFAGFEALGWVSSNNVALAISIIAGFLTGIVLSFVVDYLAKRWTGLTPLKDVSGSFPFFP